MDESLLPKKPYRYWRIGPEHLVDSRKEWTEEEIREIVRDEIEKAMVETMCSW